MRRIAIILLVFLLPLVAQAACSTDGYTVVFVNGVFDTKEQAQEDKRQLESLLPDELNNQPITYTVGYNQTHLAGAGDLFESYFPAFDQFDLNTILMQIHDEVTTRKLLIVGHSQGAVYANKIYEYLITHGEPKESVAVYAVATPDSYVAGGGKYVTYELDDLITNISKFVGLHPLPANLTFGDLLNDSGGDDASVPVQGHSFVDEYLNAFSRRIRSDINSELWVLRTGDSVTPNGCFDPPSQTLGYNSEKVALAIADPVSVVVKATAVAGYTVTATVVGTTYNLASSAIGSVLGFFAPKPSTPNADAERAANDTGMAFLHALNLTSIDMQTADELQRTAPKKKSNANDLGAAAIMALVPDEPTPTQGEVLGSSTMATTTTPFPTAPAAMPGENVHYNAPTFGGAAAAADEAPQDEPPQEEAASSSPPDEPADVLTSPTITLSNWQAIEGIQFCTLGLRHVDVSWGAVPGATYYGLSSKDDLSANNDVLATTTATTWPNLPLFTNFVIDPITLTVTAYDDAGNSATTSVRVDQALADQTPPSLLIDSITPALHATGTPVTTSIRIPFSEPLLPSSINYWDSFQLNQMPDRITVPKNLSLSQDGTTVILTPLQPLAYGTSYNLSMGCKTSDIYGNQLPNGIALFYDADPPYITTEGDPGI